MKAKAIFKEVEIAKVRVPRYHHPLHEGIVRSVQKEFDPNLCGRILLNRLPNGRLYVIDGALRLEVMRRLGYRRVRAEIVSLDAKKAKAFSLAHSSTMPVTARDRRKAAEYLERHRNDAPA